jgi:chromosome partitioning protein
MANKIILVGSEKGGVGKTTVAFNLATMRVKQGRSVLLLDADSQGSSAMWAGLRSDAEFQPTLVCVQKSGKIGRDLLELSKTYEIIIDAGGRDSVELRQAIAVADQWIIPVKAGQLDLLSITKMRNLKREVYERVEQTPETRVLLNAIAPSTREGEDARAALLQQNEGEEAGGAGDMPVMSAMLTDRVAVRRSITHGCAVVELPARENAGAAVAEFKSVFEEVFGESYVEA